MSWPRFGDAALFQVGRFGSGRGADSEWRVIRLERAPRAGSATLGPRASHRWIGPGLYKIETRDRIEVCTSLAKTVFLLGSVASLVGGVAYSLVTVKANARVNVDVTAKAAVDVNVGSKAKARSNAKAKTAAKSKAGAKKTTKAGTVKGKKTMNTINIGNKNDWYKASSLLGE